MSGLSLWNTVGVSDESVEQCVVGKSVEHCGRFGYICGILFVFWVSQWNTVGVICKSVEHSVCCG